MRKVRQRHTVPHHGRSQSLPANYSAIGFDAAEGDNVAMNPEIWYGLRRVQAKANLANSAVYGRPLHLDITPFEARRVMTITP
jgi:hypothetical protein